MARVIDIQRRHMELGRIRLGEKGSKGQPQRLDTWRLTSASKALLDSAAAIYGGTVAEWTDAPDKGYYELTTDTASLDVMVPPGDAYSQFYELWSGGGCKRRCDGATELLSDSPCKCDPEERDCKITTRINVMLPRVAGLGVWRLESHGYYAAAELPDQLDLLQQISGGRIVAGVLRIEQRSSKKDGRTNRYPVPVLDLPNVTLASLTGGSLVVNAPAPLERGKPPMLGTAELPAETAFDNSAPVGFGERPSLPPPDPRGRLLEVVKAAGLKRPDLDRLADQVGIPQGEQGTDEQIEQIIQLIEQPEVGLPTPPATPQESTPSGDQGSGQSTPPAATSVQPAGDSPPVSEPAVPSDAELLAAAGPGAELVPDKPDYVKRAEARAKAAKAEPKGARETPEPVEVTAGL